MNYYQELDTSFDYQLFDIEGRIIRGPKPDFSLPYFSCVGSAQTFGRFCEDPYPSLLSKKLGVECLNLGKGGATPENFVDDLSFIKNVSVNSRFTILQIMSARSISNSFFSSNTDTTRKKWAALLANNPNNLLPAIKEIRTKYIGYMTKLLEELPKPTILFYFSSRKPEYEICFNKVNSIWGNFPQLVDANTIAEILPFADHYVELVSTEGLPQKLPQWVPRIHGGSMNLNSYYPSPEMHQQAAEILHKKICCLNIVDSF